MTALKPNRAYDHVYDPTYITSHPNDHYRQTHKATFGPDRIARMPDDQYMFSELPHYPRHTIQVTSKNSLGSHVVGQEWLPPDVKIKVHPHADSVSGQHRFKFFNRPNKQQLSTLPHVVQYAMQRGGQKTMLADSAPNVPEPAVKTVGTQSVYRESEAQTDPYSPEYYVVPNQAPEVLALTHLTYGHGLPATLAELQIIERTRQKRLFQMMLPPPTDEFNLEVRMQLMEGQEFREWADREKQIRELQEKRLTLLKDALQERDTKRESAQMDKVERMRQRKEEERDRKLASLQRTRTKVLRKMQKERQNAEKTSTKRDVISEYADCSSQVYAPLARNGHVPDSNTAKIEVQPADLSTFPGLVQLERSLPPSLLRAADRHPKDMDRKNKSSYEKRKELEITSALKSAMEGIKKELQQPSEAETSKGGEAASSTGGVKKFNVRNILDRPDSPRLKEDILPEEEEQEAAILLLQRIIRGRAYQNRMIEGKEKRLDLINELRAAERYAETATTVEEKRYIDQLRDKAFEGVLESIQGSVISQTLDQLSKELLRFQQERRIAAMVKLAERDRQLRQAQESGRRQAEERLREREDEMFRQIMGVHKGTVDSYLEEVLTNTVEQAAQSRALTEARLKAAKINQVVDTLEASAQEPEVVVRELVHSFNLPHVQREVVKRRIAVENQRFSEAAKSALDETYRRVEDSQNEPQ
uniref:Cilia- and flagella-associated protein 91 n=2 Tax=Alexandrium TaxID=2924 RepID=A0A7S1QN72_ALECA